MEENAVLRRALQPAGKELGLSKRILAQALGEAPSFFDPGQGTSPVAPRTYQRIGLMLRLYDSLSSLVGNDVGHMRGWMGALNWPTGGIPAKQFKSLDQLEKLVFHLGVATLWHRQGATCFSCLLYQPIHGWCCWGALMVVALFSHKHQAQKVTPSSPSLLSITLPKPHGNILPRS